jgi:endonuclease III
MDGSNPHGNHTDPLDELVYITLSAQTESYLYRRTFEELKTAYTPWDKLLTASEDNITEVIRRGGLARKKAGQLKSAFSKIVADEGKLSLQFLEERSDLGVLRYLTSLPGIGTKTAKCVMMYSFGRHVFPVDTHVWRISRRLGIAPQVPKPTGVQMADLETKIPEDLRYRLHVNFVTLGKQTCRTYYPRCGECSLSELCPSSGRPDVVWSSWRRPTGVWANAMPVA